MHPSDSRAKQNIREVRAVQYLGHLCLHHSARVDHCSDMQSSFFILGVLKCWRKEIGVLLCSVEPPPIDFGEAVHRSWGYLRKWELSE